MINYASKLEGLKKVLQENEDFHPFLKDISLPFIPDFNPCFDQTKLKTVLVGQETAGWRGRLYQLVLGDLTIDDHIHDSKKRYDQLYNGPTQGLPFLSLLDRLKLSSEPVQWLNFYLCDYKKSSFNQLNKKKNCIELYNLITAFSIQNLTQQLNRLQPKNIIFVGNYHNNWDQLKSQYVSHEEIIIPKDSVDNFSLRIWNEKTLVIRTPHPASRTKNKMALLNLALHYYSVFNDSMQQDIQLFKEMIRSNSIEDLSERK